eukprot:COSAG06_NODE_2394_length_6958_cov_4.596151_10_plen_78_part_00
MILPLCFVDASASDRLPDRSFARYPAEERAGITKGENTSQFSTYFTAQGRLRRRGSPLRAVHVLRVVRLVGLNLGFK